MSIAAAFVGALIGSWTSWLIAICVPRFRHIFYVWEKIIDKRIEAHERVIRIAASMKKVCFLPNFTDHTRIPEVLSSQDFFHQWLIDAQQHYLDYDCWLSNDVKAEMVYFQDYMANVLKALEGKSEDVYHKVGVIIREDFIGLASSLHKSAFEYFREEVHLLKSSHDDNWYDEAKSRSSQRLLETRFFKEKDKINLILLSAS